METKSYQVEVETIDTDEGKVFTGWIRGIKGTVVQSTSLPNVFIELGTQLEVLERINS